MHELSNIEVRAFLSDARPEVGIREPIPAGCPEPFLSRIIEARAKHINKLLKRSAFATTEVVQATAEEKTVDELRRRAALAVNE
jgi:hypothetical protein